MVSDAIAVILPMHATATHTVNVPVHRIRRRKDTTIIAATAAHDATVIGNIRDKADHMSETPKYIFL